MTSKIQPIHCFHECLQCVSQIVWIIMVNRYFILSSECCTWSRSKKYDEERNENVSLPPFYICIFANTIQFELQCMHFCWCNFAMIAREYGAQNEPETKTNMQPTNQPSNGKAMKAMEMETRLETALSNYWNMWHRIIPTYCVCLNATRTAAILFHSLHIWLLNLFLQRQVFSAKLETTETLMKWICNTDYIVIASSLSLSLSKIMAVQNISFLTLIGIKLC